MATSPPTRQNDTIKGSFEPCMIVPAVTEVCLPQAAHSKVKGFPPCGTSARPCHYPSYARSLRDKPQGENSGGKSMAVSELQLPALFVGRYFTIPDYQREFAWTEAHCRDLIQDIDAIDIKRPINRFIGYITGHP